MKALFRSVNLIGDGLNIYPALATWCAMHRDWEIDLYTLPDSVDMYKAFNININVISGPDPKEEKEYDFEFTFDCGKAFLVGDRDRCHIAEAYAKLLEVYESVMDWQLRFEPKEEEHERDLILISPFSRSCSSHSGLPANKTLPIEKLAPLIELLRRRGRIGILGAADDRLPLPIDETEYYTGLSLNTVALMLRDCKYLVGIDNGIAHLAATQQTKSVILYPACLGLHWIVPINRNAKVVHMDPVAIELPYLFWRVKSHIEEFAQ